MKITQRAYAKINWSLDVLGRRSDGYHELDMLMQSISLYDELTFESADELTLHVGGRNVPGDGRNLVLCAAEALIRATGRRRGARISLMKRIPVRAGLGGGSADCGATLLALNRLWRLNMPLRELVQVGAALGSDVPFCMGQGLARVSGVGDRLLRMRAGARHYLVILHPGMGLSTAQVYAKWDENGEKTLNLDLDGAQRALMAGDIFALSTLAGNALEPPAIDLMPEIWIAREQLTDLGAVFAQMSGSGSAVYGVFETSEGAQAAKAVLGYKAILTQTYP
ncbi:MAG: 4-(cytidine 5'-diphospho)-2-C-methyl-D-erythritol kinase [Clostridia bacterium]